MQLELGTNSTCRMSSQAFSIPRGLAGNQLEYTDPVTGEIRWDWILHSTSGADSAVGRGNVTPDKVTGSNLNYIATGSDARFNSKQVSVCIANIMTVTWRFKFASCLMLLIEPV